MKIEIKQQKPVNVTIIGAGLGGLCLAHGLKKAGVNFHVFEKDASPYSRAQGYRIRIDQTGQQALSRCLSANLYQAFVSTSIASRTVNKLNAQLQPTEKWINSWNNDETIAPDLKVNRLTLREILLTGLENVHFNKKLTGYQHLENDTIRIDFEDGTCHKADIVIAADGINSALAAIRFPENKIADTGSVCIYGKSLYTNAVKEQVAAVLQTDTSVIFEDSLAMITDAMQFGNSFSQSGIPLTATADYIYWAIIGKREKLGIKKSEDLRLSPTEISKLIQNAANSWDPQLKALFDNGEPEAMTIVPVRTSLPKKPWLSDSVTALGDAIHAMSPAGGLGANTALHDAALLAEQIGLIVNSGKDKLAAIAAYEDAMRAHSIAAVAASQSGAAVLYNQNKT